MGENRLAPEENKFHVAPISSIDRQWLLIFFDILALNAGFLVSLGFREDYVLSWMLIRENPIWFVLLNALWFFWGYIFQVYDLERAGRIDSAFFRIAGVGLLVVSSFNLIPYLPPALPPSRAPLFVTIGFPVLLLSAGRGLYLAVFGRPEMRRRVLILGAGWAGGTICRTLEDHGSALYEVVGFLDDDPDKIGRSIHIQHTNQREKGVTPAMYPVFGPTEKLVDIVSRYEISMIVLAITHNVRGELYQHLSDSLQLDVDVLPMPLLYEQLTGKVPVEHIGDHWMVSMPLDHPGTKVIWKVGKRLFDLVWAGLGSVFLVLVFPFIALVIYVDSPGPVFYRQKRLGKNGKEFMLLKLRSMVPEAEQGQVVWAEENDSRITRVGKFLRKTHLDEFPQFWNILRGEMSVVGPRPERPEFVKQLSEKIPFYRVRLAVKPGMAGWGLIHQGYGASVDDALEKLKYDLYYVKHQSFFLDLFILFQTIMNALFLGGR